MRSSQAAGSSAAVTSNSRIRVRGGTVLRVPTTAGTVWLKATAPETGFEVGLYELLTRSPRDRVLTPIASDATRGWIVLPDRGTSLMGSFHWPRSGQGAHDGARALRGVAAALALHADSRLLVWHHRPASWPSGTITADGRPAVTAAAVSAPATSMTSRVCW